MATEKRLIDANAIVVPKYDVEGRDLFNQGYCQGKTDGILEVKVLAPTVDAVEVVHGRWEKYGKHDWRCSVCKVGVPYSYTGHKYCHNCGAKMDGGWNG